MARKSPKGRAESRKGMGFEAAAESAAESYGGNIERGKAAVAAGARKAGAKARRANPNLSKVAGVGKRKGAGERG